MAGIEKAERAGLSPPGLGTVGRHLVFASRHGVRTILLRLRTPAEIAAANRWFLRNRALRYIGLFFTRSSGQGRSVTPTNAFACANDRSCRGRLRSLWVVGDDSPIEAFNCGGLGNTIEDLVEWLKDHHYVGDDAIGLDPIMSDL
jgi:hypothetical protein